MLLWGHAGAHAAHVRVRGEAGVEHDTNPGRRETIEGEPNPPRIEASPALHALVTGEGLLATGSRGRLFLSGSGAGRRFLREEARGDDMAIVQGLLDWDFAFLQRTAAGLNVSYYEAFQHRGAGMCLFEGMDPQECLDRGVRDFRSLAPVARFAQGVGSGQISAGGGYRLFVYKPEDDFDFHGPSAFLRYRQLVRPDEDDEEGADWDINLGLSLERRHFGGQRCVANEECPPPTPLGNRVDDFGMFTLETVRTGDFLLGGGGALYFNRSNSFGQGLIRYAIYLKGALVLPWQLLLSWRAEVLLSHYSERLPLVRDPTTGQPRVSIEDESRNTLRTDLSRALGGGIDITLRYLFFTNEIGTGPVDYRRHNVMLLLGYTWESR